MADIDKFTGNYNTLTINGITKICDDKIYVHNRKVINYQWHNFQLIYILETLLKESAIDDITGLELPKLEICKKIKKILSSRKIQKILASGLSKKYYGSFWGGAHQDLGGSRNNEMGKPTLVFIAHLWGAINA